MSRLEGHTELLTCEKLIRLDLSLVDDYLPVHDLLRVVCNLSNLKVFHFPSCNCWASLDSDENDAEQTAKEISDWPSSLEIFHIPSWSCSGYTPALKKPPASLKRLVIEDGEDLYTPELVKACRLIGSWIKSLQVNYNGVHVNEIRENFDHFPNLLQLNIRPGLIFVDAIFSAHVAVNHPLRSVTVELDMLDQILDTDLLGYIDENYLVEDRFPDIRSILLSSSSSIDEILSFVKRYRFPIDQSPEEDLNFVNAIHSSLKRRSPLEGDRNQDGVLLMKERWMKLMKYRDNESTVLDFTSKIISDIQKRQNTSLSSQNDQLHELSS
jgi:hypothetical protein